MVRRAGIDVGGTKCLGVVVDDTGRIVLEARRPTPRGSVALIDVLADLAGELAPFGSLGIGLPGLVTHDGVLRAAPNLPGVTDFALGPLMERRIGQPVAVFNDATCAAVAEWQQGAARGATDVLMVTLGTGIGGGIVSSGRVVTGANGFAGEFGHMTVDPGGPPCPCGRRGCWERFASGSGLARLAREAAVGGRLRRVVELAGDPEDVRGEHVQQAAREGDAAALEVVEEFCGWVALGLANLTNALDPELIVLGGGLAVSQDLYLAPVARAFNDRLYSPEHRAHPRVTFAELGEQAGAIGAALLPGT